LQSSMTRRLRMARSANGTPVSGLSST
jgi:hypothetical protein